MLPVWALQETPFFYCPSSPLPIWQMKFHPSHLLPSLLRKTWLTEVPHDGKWMQLRHWKENTIKQRGSVNILPGECHANNTENVRNDPLLKLQYLKEDFDPNPNLHTAKGNPDWGPSWQQCRSERKELDSACFRAQAGKKLAAASNFGRMEHSDWGCVLCLKSTWNTKIYLSAASTQTLFCSSAKY